MKGSSEDMSSDVGNLGRTNVSPAHQGVRPSDRELISRALTLLRPSQRDVIQKAYYRGWTIGQIAADLDITEPAVKRRLHHALHALRSSLLQLD